MSNSSRGRGFGRRSGTVTVIEQQVHRSAAVDARFAFILTVIVVGLVALVVAKDHMHPILAIFVAAPIAILCGALVWALVRIWPVIRLIWWWTPEITLTVLAAWGWTALAANTPGLLTLAILAVLVGGSAVVPFLRRWVKALFWCIAVRHRLRICFSQFIIANKSGSLPLILLALPTPVGERVWVILRPGLSLQYLTGKLPEIAVACHATTALIAHAGGGNSAIVRFDIKRREVLTADIRSPLVDVIDPDVPLTGKKPATVTGGLDLPDVDGTTAAATVPPQPKPAPPRNGKKPEPPAEDADDLSQYI